ncbi:MAG: serine hydrolase domain-containing protein [Thermomicrobiales bacterium]
MTDSGNYEERLAGVAARIERWVTDGEIPGAAVAVAYQGRLVWDSYSGHARESVASSPDVIWPLASISKLYTAAMIMSLVEQGELTLGMTVQSVIPEFTGGGKDEVLLRHLLTHTSGMIYESPEHPKRLENQVPYGELIDESYIYPLMFKPGEKLSYSDYGVALAGRVAERVTGKDFVSLVDELVLRPSGLEETTFRPDDAELSRCAHVEGTYADGTDGAMYNSRYGLNLAHPAFGTVASVRDLVKFGLNFAPSGPRFLSDATVRAMTIDQTGGHSASVIPGFLDSNVPTPWGIGFMVALGSNPFQPDLLPRGSYGHGGASGCTIWIDPENDIVVGYVSNKHALTGRPPFTRRLVSVVNMVLASLTRS